MAPQRRSDFSQIVLRALCTGACVSLVNACVAGILYVPGGTQVNCTMLLNTTLSASSFEVYRCCREAFQRGTVAKMPTASGCSLPSSTRWGGCTGHCLRAIPHGAAVRTVRTGPLMSQYYGWPHPSLALRLPGCRGQSL